MRRSSCHHLLALMLGLTCIASGTTCTRSTPAPKRWVSDTRGERVILRNGRLPGGDVVDVEIRGNTIVNVGKINAPGRDIGGMWVVPGFIDSHVHLNLLPVSDKLALGGVVGVVDLASPPVDRAGHTGRLFSLRSGPMLTVERGYPTQSWGSGGYGQECGSKEEAVAAVDKLLARGSSLIKVAMGVNGMPVPWVEAVVERAHERKVKVAVHALGRADAERAVSTEADILAHVPMEALGEKTVAEWGKRAVITTLAAFGGSAEAIENLRAMREHGAITLYGTDLGNSKFPGIHPDEIQLMMAAGMSSADIIASGTSIPAEYWGFEHLGAIAPGKAASFILLAEDPIADPTALTRASHVYIDGVRLR